jgi:hypothetical protein
LTLIAIKADDNERIVQCEKRGYAICKEHISSEVDFSSITNSFIEEMATTSVETADPDNPPVKEPVRNGVYIYLQGICLDIPTGTYLSVVCLFPNG